jgi:hypothetical protein
MRHLLIRLAAVAFFFGLGFGLGPATAAPLPKVDGLAVQTDSVEPVGYYRYRYPYRRGYSIPLSALLLGLVSAMAALPLPALLPSLLVVEPRAKPRIGGFPAAPQFSPRTLVRN